MAELDEKLQSIFSSPEAMEQVMSIAKGLMGGSDDVSNAPSGVDNGSGAAPPEPPATPEAAATSAIPDLTMLAGLDPQLISLAMSVFGEYSKDDRDVRLLHAIKPHLKTGRSERVDHAIQILKMSKAVRAAMRGFGGNADNV